MERVYERSKADFVSKVMMQMGVGLFISFLTAYLTVRSDTLFNLVFGSTFIFLILMFSELGLVIYLTRSINRMSFAQARIGFYVYAVLNGLTLSSIFMIYNITSIYSVFLTAAIMFVISGLIGMSTKRDLSSLGRFFMAALIGIIAASILNMFLGLTSLDLMISIVGVLLFSGITAYDMQKIREIHYNAYNLDGEITAKYSILAALELYLDFINLFLYLLRLFGRRRS
jgi:FtsH-binding integral membrane protein